METRKLSLGILRAFLLAATLIAHCHSIQAATILWTNTLGGNWSDPGSWSPNTIPSDSDDVFILAAGTFDVSLDTSTTINSLTIAGEPGSAPTFHTGIS